jgi:hypothetical protein
LWELPARELAVLLFQMTEHGTGAAAYYADMTQAVLTMAVCAPGPPPASAADFLDRLDPAWLEAASAGGRPGGGAAGRAPRPHLGDIQLRYATLLGRLGPALDGPGRLHDAGAWYFILEGTSEPSVAEAQAMAIAELIAHAATSRHAEPRALLLAADDYSAVARRVPLSSLYERGRSLGLGVMVSAQSWQGLGRDDDERYRIAATADGGLWLLQTPHPEPLVALAGTRRVLETAHKLIGAAWGDEGTSRIQHAWTADPNLIRRLGTGQACYIHRGSATYVQVARPRPSPLSLPAARTRTRLAPIPPGRADGGNPAAYAAATAAYAQLRTPWGRTEALADLASGAPVPAPDPPPTTTRPPPPSPPASANSTPPRTRRSPPWNSCPPTRPTPPPPPCAPASWTGSPSSTPTAPRPEPSSRPWPAPPPARPTPPSWTRSPTPATSCRPAARPQGPPVRRLRPGHLVEQARQPGHRAHRDHRRNPPRPARPPQPRPGRLPRHPRPGHRQPGQHRTNRAFDTTQEGAPAAESGPWRSERRKPVQANAGMTSVANSSAERRVSAGVMSPKHSSRAM